MKNNGRLLVALVLLISLLLPPTTAGAQDGGEDVPNPVISVFPDRDAVEGWNWPVGVPLYLAVDNPQTVQSPDILIDVSAEPTPWDPESYWVEHTFGDYDIQPGDWVTLTDGTIARTHVVEKLSITRIELDADTVTGLADPGKLVYVWPHDTGITVEAIASKKGKWEANFSGVDDLVAGKNIRAEIRDEQGNATTFDYYMANPRFTVFPQWEWFDAIDWPNGALLTIRVDDKPECEIQRESSDYFINGNFGEGCDVTFGDEVTFTDGITHRTHIVRGIAVTGFDLDAEVIYGTTDPLTPVSLWLNDDWNVHFPAASDEWGNWAVSVAGTYDLNPGSSGMVEVADAEGNATWIDWHVPNPRIVANLDENWIALWSFTTDAFADVTVYDVDGVTELWSGGQLPLDGNGYRWVDPSLDLLPGMTVVAADGIDTRTLVLEGLTFDRLDLFTGASWGTASEPFGREVWVAVGLPNGDIWSRMVNTDEAGNWSASFDATVPSDYAWAAAQVFDEDYDGSEVRPAEYTRATWRDDFNGSIDPAWESMGDYSFDVSSSFLRMDTSSTPTPEGNWLLRPVGEGDFSIETRLLFEPNTDFQFAGLLLWQDDQNFIQFGRAFCDVEDCSGNAIYFDRVSSSLGFWHAYREAGVPNEAYLRLEKRGNEVRAYYSQEGITWTEFARDWPFDAGFQINKVGLVASQSFFGDAVPADFDYFELSEGFNFLPYGYHDYDVGVVPSWNCNAGGWTADPDNRSLDLSVEINVDGASLPAWLSASLYRPDLDEAGVCEDGNCAFNGNIYDSITPDVPHDIATFAQDYPSGEWVLLENSPKSLTCLSQ